MITILIADDHQILREGLRKGFEAAGEQVVAEAGDGEEAVELCLEHRPDVVLMDLTMPVLDGVAATRRIHEDCPDTRVVILTMHDDVARTRAALGAGAVAYLTKGGAFADVLQTVRSVADGETVLSPELAFSMLQAMAGADDEPVADEPILSERHIEILQLIADGMTTKQAARELGITQKTVHNHLNSVYRRLDTQNLTHAVLSAVRLGIIELN